uniref:Translation initiation factor 5A C-terminal domain-containing protein n=1 Tax=Mola mola TaxID=94237 RepID=A0A3Q3WKC5_MOLML
MADDFQSGHSGASETYPVQCSALRKNGHVMLKGRPCKIVSMTTSKTGKHGHAKVKPPHTSFGMQGFRQICKLAQCFTVCDISDNFLHLMHDNGELREDLKLPDTDVGKEIKKKFDNGDNFSVTVLKALQEEQVFGIKAITKEQGDA